MIDRADLLAVLACPACKSPLHTLLKCDSCGMTFSDLDGTPVLVPHGARRQVSFNFSQERASAGSAFENAFKYPIFRETEDNDKPYHLDLAHLDVLSHLPPNSSVLEIGCGGGQMRTFLLQKNLKYIGTDISKTRIHEYLRVHGGPDALCDAHFLPFVDGAFDVVYSAAVTEHLACPHLVAQEVWRVLKPGGYYLGNVSFLEPWHDNSFFHMTPLGVFELLTQAKFDVDNIWPGRGYSGFRAIFRMGNKVTKRIAFVGELASFAYNTGNRLRNRLRRASPNAINGGIVDAARVAGATDWIARRPLAAQKG